MWEQDYCLSPDEDDSFTDFLLGDSFDIDNLEEKTEVQTKEPEGRPFWHAKVEYSNHTVQNISSYNEYLPERPEELFFLMKEYFELDVDVF